MTLTPEQLAAAEKKAEQEMIEATWGAEATPATEERAERVYVKGSAKANTHDGVEYINLSILVADLEVIKNEKGYAAITVVKRKETGQYGDTHNVYVNTYKPS